MRILADGDHRILEGDTPYLRYRVVDGVVEMWEVRQPDAVRVETDPPARHRRIMPPGDWLAMLIQVVTFGMIRPCTSCKSRLAAMNRAGWRGLFGLWTRWLQSKLGKRPRPGTSTNS